MRRWSTWLLVGALTALGAVAAADALRPALDAPVASAEETETTKLAPRPGEPQGLLAAAAADCSVAAVMLPGSIRLRPRGAVNCDGGVWSADHTLTANCTGGVTTVAGLDRGVVVRLRGCSPAWRPDGAVSVITDDGDVVVARRRGRPQTFLTRQELTAELKELKDGRSYELVELAWHGAVAFAGIVAGPKPAQRAVIYYTPEGVTTILPEVGKDVSGIRTSPLGNMVAFRRDGEIVVLDQSGREVPTPQVAGARAIAWSENERWTAIATTTETLIARTGSTDVVMRLELGGDTLEWLDSGPR